MDDVLAIMHDDAGKAHAGGFFMEGNGLHDPVQTVGLAGGAVVCQVVRLDAAARELRRSQSPR
jgi:hypothetical protein